MNKSLIGLFSIFLGLIAPICAQQSIAFLPLHWEQLSEKAHQTNKLIFVDVYADWCGPCKKMDKHIFPDSDVITFFEQNFVNTKADAEQPLGQEFIENFPIKGLPSYCFITPEGEVIYQVHGAVDSVSTFLEYAQTALDIQQHLQNYQEISNLNSLYHYTLYLYHEEDLNYQQYFKEYITQQENLTTPRNISFVIELAKEQNTVPYNFFWRNEAMYQQHVAPAVLYDLKTTWIKQHIAERYKDSIPETLEEFKPLFHIYFKGDSLQYYLQFQLQYYQEKLKFEPLENAIQAYHNQWITTIKSPKERAKEQYMLAQLMYNVAMTMEDEKKGLEQALKWALEVQEIEQNYAVCYLIQEIYRSLGDEQHFYEQVEKCESYKTE